MSQTRGLHLLAYQAKRVRQTVQVFRNWPRLLADMAGRGSTDELAFITRTGVTMSTPNVPGARLPMYEQFADDCYDIDWVLGSDRDRPWQVLDVGSHVGAFATNLATTGVHVRVECFEPSPESARYLRRNVEQNGLGERVSVHEAAMSGEIGTAMLDDNSGGSVHNGLVKEDHRLVAGSDGAGQRRTITVPTTTFDAAVAAAPAPIDIVKMDCEGGEYDLVYASDPGNWASVQRVVMEYHPVEGETWDELRAWLENVGLSVVRHSSDSPGLGTAWLERTTA